MPGSSTTPTSSPSSAFAPAPRSRPAKGGEVALSPDTLERLSYLFGIYKALQMLLPSTEAADAWIRKPNAGSLFNGVSALDRLRAGKVADLFLVRQYLDAQRGGWG